MRNANKPAGKLKTELLNVAVRLFRERGYARTTYQVIADELGVSKAAISYHFQSKPWIIFSFFERFLSAIYEHLRENLTENFNFYLYHCTAQILFYRELIKDEPSRTLFYMDEHMAIWGPENGRLIEGYIRDIADDFHRQMTDEEIHVAATMDFGAKRSMFEESARYSERGEIDAYCRHLIYMVGLLARLDELTIQLNIQRAFAFADEHPLPFGLY